MGTQVVGVPTPDGIAPGIFCMPPGAGPWPGALLFMDALGLRPALIAMAKRLASHGYAVLLPDFYYRSSRSERPEPERALTDPAARARMLELYHTLTPTRVVSDTGALLDFLAREPRVRGPAFGCVGYCMGGGIALRAAGEHGVRIAAAACIHGAGLATGAADSPHLLAPRMRAELYVAVAEIDPWLAPDETERLRAALKSAGVRHEIEVLAGAQHGFAVGGSPLYHAAAADRHWERVLALFARALGGPSA